jgi:protein disulfide-isomerase A1
MYQKRIAYGLMAAFAAVGSAADAASDVEQLTKDTFDEFVKANDLVLAECTCSSASIQPTQTLTVA